jgi:hypothetical protein
MIRVTKIAVAVFAGTCVALLFAFNGLRHYSLKTGRLLAQNADSREIRQITRQYRPGPLMYLSKSCF